MAKLSSTFAVFVAALPFVSCQLHDLATVAGKLYFGSATDNPELTDESYVAILSNTSEFGQITPGNSMKWDATEPQHGVFTFDAGEVITDLANSNGQLIRGHNCVWHNQLPSWVSNGGFDNATLLEIVATHCSTIVSHWAGQIYAWDVVNEPIGDDGAIRDSVFFKTTGTAFVATALRAAREADPDAKLYINDYGIESTGTKQELEFELVHSMLDQGVPLDGVGFQAHLIVGSVPSLDDLVSSLERFANLGLEVAYTELDIRMTLPETDELLMQQQMDYETVINACLQVKACVGMTIWDYTDKYSWVPSTFEGQGAACPWDESLEKKPAYSGIITALSS